MFTNTYESRKKLDFLKITLEGYSPTVYTLCLKPATLAADENDTICHSFAFKKQVDIIKTENNT